MTPPSSSHSNPPRLPAAGALQCPNCGAASDEQATRCQYCQAPLAMIGCPNCFRRLFAGANYCSHCGTRAEVRERERLGKPEGVVCPSCHKLMGAARVGTLSLDECTACSGVWVSARLFEQLCADREAQSAIVHGGALRGQTAAAPGVELRVRYRPCPRCRKLMNRVNFASGAKVVLDICREHGTFFDRDELHRVVTFIQAGGMERARAREREALKEEQARLRALQVATRPGGTGMEPLNLRDHTIFESAGLFDVFVHALIDR
jgi:Zn-finger nucleic acid-binding protein